MKLMFMTRNDAAYNFVLPIKTSLESNKKNKNVQRFELRNLLEKMSRTSLFPMFFVCVHISKKSAPIFFNDLSFW